MNQNDLPEIPALTPVTRPRFVRITDIPKSHMDIPEMKPVTRRVAELSHELAAELGMIRCRYCRRYYCAEQIVTTDPRWPVCTACSEDDGHSGWFERHDQPRRI